MAEGASRKSPWAMRLAIAGALLLVIGAIIVSAQKEAIDSVYDPREMSIAQIDDGNSVTFDVQKNGCYMAIVSDNEPDVDVELTPIVGSAAATEKLTPKSCFSDWIPMASDGAGFEIHSQWIVDESGEMLASSSCTGEMCEEQTIWLVHIDNWELKLLESSGLVFGFGICCLGLILLPIAGIIAYSTRSNKIHGSLRVVGRDGELLQSFDTQEEMMDVYNNAIAEGFEGVIVKDPNASYDFGSRSNSWLKYKPPMVDIDCIVTDATLGSGKRAGVYGAYNIAIKDGDELVSFGKVGSGFTDLDLTFLTQEYNRLGAGNLIIEVKGDMITKNESGEYGLRFPRYVKYRDDKEEPTQLKDIME